MPRITIWNEYQHELADEAVRRHYPDGIHEALKRGIGQQLEGNPQLPAGSSPRFRTATLAEPEHGLSAAVLADTDVLLWWGHQAHDQVSDAVVDAVQQRVLAGMGLIVLHSGHYSKIFKRLMGTNCSLRWREADDRERFWNLQPSHPILLGLPDHFELENEEMYGERFDIPEPDELLLISWFTGGEVFRSLCTWQRGNGRVVYFRPGHETHPTYHDTNVLRVIANACLWARQRIDASTADAPNTAALE
jgi:trehalose utilization protein